MIRRITRGNGDIVQFWKKHGHKKPFIVTDIAESWPISKLSLSEIQSRYGDELLEVGRTSGDDGEGVLQTLNQFIQYASSTKDSDPLYLFDGTFNIGAPKLADSYR